MCAMDSGWLNATKDTSDAFFKTAHAFPGNRIHDLSVAIAPCSTAWVTGMQQCWGFHAWNILEEKLSFQKLTFAFWRWWIIFPIFPTCNGSVSREGVVFIAGIFNDITKLWNLPGHDKLSMINWSWLITRYHYERHDDRGCYNISDFL